MTKKSNELNQELERLHEEVSRLVVRKGIRVSVARDEIAVERGYASWNAMVRTGEKAKGHRDGLTRLYELVVGQTRSKKPPSLEEVLLAMRPRQKARFAVVGQARHVFQLPSEAERIAAAMRFLIYTGMRLSEASEVVLSKSPPSRKGR